MTPRPTSRAVRLGGITLHVADDQPTFWDRVEAGRWEPGTLAVLGRLLRPGVTFLDLGAWVGPLALYAAALGARVIAVEADPAALGQLRRNLDANPDLAPQVTVVPRAAAAQPGPVRMGARRKPGDSMSSTLLAGADATWEAEAVTPPELDGLVGAAGRLVVKIDIEGGEYDLLPRLGPLLGRPGTSVLLSLHPDILAEAGETDPDARREGALSGFAGWHAFAVEDDGLEPFESGRIEASDCLLLVAPEKATTDGIAIPAGADGHSY